MGLVGHDRSMSADLVPGQGITLEATPSPGLWRQGLRAFGRALLWVCCMEAVLAIPVVDGVLARTEIGFFPLVGGGIVGLIMTCWVVGVGVAVVVIARGVRTTRLKLVVVVLFSVVAVALSGWTSSWTMLDPRSNFFVHQYRFAMLAEVLDRGDFRGTHEYYGDPLPISLASLSLNGRVSIRGTCKGQPVYFVPRWVGMPDDAGGYLYFPGLPEPGESCFLDLWGRPGYLSEAEPLSKGWWWL